MPPDFDAPNSLLKDLYRQRRERKVTLQELADRAGFANASVPARLERADANPTLRSVMRYAAALGASLKVEVETVKRIAFFQYAGGSSKTSLTRDVGAVLARRGFRVLLVDTDPQASLTSWLGIDKYDVGAEETLLPVTAAKNVPLPASKRVHGVDLIPSTPAFARAEPNLLGGIGPVHRIRDAIDKVEGDYDFVLIDTPPSLGQITAAAVIAADYIVVPILAHAKGADGLPTVMEMVEDWRRAIPNLSVLAFVPTQLDNTKISRDYMGLIQEQLSEVAPVTPALARRPAVYARATEEKVPVPLLSPEPREAVAEVGAVVDLLLAELGVSAGAAVGR